MTLNPRTPRILLDIDGVCADFVTPVLGFLNRVMGTHHDESCVTQWDIVKSVGAGAYEAELLDKHIKTEGFCAGLQMYPGVAYGVEFLRRFADVYAVTAPYPGPHWIPERLEWLKQHLGFDAKHVVFTDAKQVVYGDALVDDKTSTLTTWGAEYGKRPIQFRRPWNRCDDWDGAKAEDWNHLTALLYAYLGDNL